MSTPLEHTDEHADTARLGITLLITLLCSSAPPHASEHVPVTSRTGWLKGCFLHERMRDARRHEPARADDQASMRKQTRSTEARAKEEEENPPAFDHVTKHPGQPPD